MTFGSVYEILDPLTRIRKQRFWDWFDGNALRNWWIFSQSNGTGVGSMVDVIDEGFQIEVTSTGSNHRSTIDYNDKRHYSETASVVIGIIRRVTANTLAHVGSHNIDSSSVSVNQVIYANDDGGPFKAITSSDGGTTSTVDSDVATDTNFTNYKTTRQSADLLLHIAGILKVTKTTNRPTLKQQPAFQSFSTTAASGKQSRIRYLEAYNT